MSGNLQAGAATSNITPWLGVTIPGAVRTRSAQDVDDELMAKALVLDNGSARIALVTCDLIAIPQNIGDAVKARVQDRCQIPPENVMINATHTHTAAGIADLLGTDGSPDYIEWVHLKIADAVELACQRLTPAKIGFASVDEDRIAFNRRWHMSDGTVRMNPGKDNPNLVEPTGPTDPELAMIYVESNGGDPISAVASYSLHYIGTDHGNAISADYFGHFFRLMRHYLSDQCVPLLWNAASGQINNIDVSGARVWDNRGHAHAKKMATVLAGHMLTEIQLMNMREGLSLSGVVEDFEFPRKTITEQDLVIANKILSVPSGEYDQYDSGPFSWVVGHPIPPGTADVYAQECIRLSKLPETLKAPVQVLKLGEAAVVALPGEIFVETGLSIKTKSDARPLFLVSLANGYIGYVCTDEALQNQGGYETWAAMSSLGGVGTEPAMEKLAVSLLDRA
jgi:neutral ceramidase